MVGGADHGYSEAIYLEDPEGNGIELIGTSLRLIGIFGRCVAYRVTEAPWLKEIYELGQEVQPFSIAEGTRMGHVHLSVKIAERPVILPKASRLRG